MCHKGVLLLVGGKEGKEKEKGREKEKLRLVVTQQQHFLLRVSLYQSNNVFMIDLHPCCWVLGKFFQINQCVSEIISKRRCIRSQLLLLCIVGSTFSHVTASFDDMVRCFGPYTF